MWLYNSPVGLMRIFFNSSERYSLEIDGTVYGFYHSPIAAADDVYTHSTGCDSWDLLDGNIQDVPTDLYEWEHR